MKQVILIGLFLGGVLGRPQAPAPAASSAPKANVTIVKNDRVSNDGKGNYNYDIELSDGTKLIQMGGTIPPPAGGNDTEPILVIKGSYSYVDPNGKTIEIKYIADDKGFQPTGDAIPTVSNSSAPAAPAAAAAAPAPAAAVAPAPAAVAVAQPVEPVPEVPLETQASSLASAPSSIA